MRGCGHTEAQIIEGLKQVEGGPKRSRSGTAMRGIEVYDLCVESQVWRHGCERGARGETVPGREWPAATRSPNQPLVIRGRFELEEAARLSPETIISGVRTGQELRARSNDDNHALNTSKQRL
jgi:hypothetical protein